MPINPKERGLLKGAIRRVFARSELRREVIEAAKVDHIDSSRPRVKKWGRCAVCKALSPLYLMSVDHINPVIPVDRSFEDMSLDETVSRMWCEKKDLQAICESCHNEKTRCERKLRTENKRKKKK